MSPVCAAVAAYAAAATGTNAQFLRCQPPPIMIDLTASDGTLFEPHLNGLNEQKNSNGAVEFIRIDSNAERRRRRMRRQGPVAFCCKIRTFCKCCRFLGDRRRFAHNIDMQSGLL